MANHPQEAPLAKLLVVDDEAAQMTALRNTLQRQGYEVVGCTHAQAGLAAMREQSFDLLLADLMMPDIDGIALLRSALQIDPTLVGIIMTGAGTISSAVQAMQSGALDYILKPFKMSAIVPVLSRALAMRRLRLANLELERRIRERSIELEAANTELDAFTRSASHDLRTPLNAVIGFAQLLSNHVGPQLADEGREWLAQIEQAGNRMNELIEDLLRLSRLGRQALKLETVDVKALVQGVLEDLSRTPHATHAAPRIGALPPVMADASLLRQVFMNLVSNALKFTRQTPQPEIEIDVEQQGPDQVVVVRDNGVGFDMAQADRLFGAFERLHDEAHFDGTGIGLTIVQRVVQRHGGRIWATARPGHGATFYFTLSGTAQVADLSN